MHRIALRAAPCRLNRFDPSNRSHMVGNRSSGGEHCRFQEHYRLQRPMNHGMIGKSISSRCIQPFNLDFIDLYGRVRSERSSSLANRKPAANAATAGGDMSSCIFLFMMRAG
jgi:hypothetical protein